MRPDAVAPGAEAAVVDDDRVRYLAMVAATTAARLRASEAAAGDGREPAITAARPRSRVDCRRRCGADGFCDRSSPSGCGGEFCLTGDDQL